MNNSQKAKILFFLGSLTSSISAHAFSKNKEAPTPPPQPYYYDANSHDVFIFSDYLFWKPFVSNGLDWVQIPASSLPQLPVMNFNWGSGFRAEVGYRGAQSKTGNYVHPWQVQATYLTYQTKAPTTRGSNNPPIVFNYFSNSSFTYDRIDLSAAWPFWLSTNAIFRILIGASGVKLQDKNTVISNTLNMITSNVESDNWKFNWNYTAAGILTGADACLPLGCGFGLFANLTALFLGGNFKEKAQYTHIDTPLEFEFKRNNTLKAVPKSIIDFRTGLDFKYWLQKSCLVYLFLGYEITWMIEMDQLRRQLDIAEEQIFTNTPTTMGTQGMTIRFGFEF